MYCWSYCITGRTVHLVHRVQIVTDIRWLFRPMHARLTAVHVSVVLYLQLCSGGKNVIEHERLLGWVYFDIRLKWR